MAVFITFLLFTHCCSAIGRAQQADMTRFEVVPLANHQSSMRAYGRELARWHFGHQYPRPFVFPFQCGNAQLTRMGHPGAPDHDHHRSIWFAHANVNGYDFWSDNGQTKIRQKSWISFQDGDDECIMAVLCGWFSSDGKEQMEQDVILALRRGKNDANTMLELQSIFRPGKDAQQTVLGKSNFGVLAVRVAKSMSAHFGDGEITDAHRRRGEQEIFGRSSAWMNYSGSVPMEKNDIRSYSKYGITYMSHSANPRHPPKWHVREDGWMGASFCRDESYTLKSGESLTLRYLLKGYQGDPSHASIERDYAEFNRRPKFKIKKSEKKHQQYEVIREN